MFFFSQLTGCVIGSNAHIDKLCTLTNCLVYFFILFYFNAHVDKPCTLTNCLVSLSVARERERERERE